MGALSRRSRPRTGCVLLPVAFAAAAGIAGFVLWQAVAGDGLDTMAARVDRLSGPLGAVRLGLIGMVAWFWPRHAERRDTADEGADAPPRSGVRPCNGRWRVVGWLLVIELLVGRNLFGRFAAAVAGGAP